MPKTASPLRDDDADAIESGLRFWEKIREVIADEVNRQVKPVAADAKAARLAVNKLAEQVAATNQILSAMQTNISMTVSWITKRGLKEDALEEKIDKYLELVTPVIPPPTPPSGDLP